MITKYTKQTIKDAIEDEDFIYMYTSLIADKLRAIYVLFGWSHQLKEFSSAQDTIDELMMYCFKEIAKGSETVSVETAGLHLEAWLDKDEFVNIDYYFNLA